MLNRIQLLKFAAAGVVVVCTLGTPVRADELARSYDALPPCWGGNHAYAD
jgi:hypothetical protein